MLRLGDARRSLLTALVEKDCPKKPKMGTWLAAFEEDCTIPPCEFHAESVHPTPCQTTRSPARLHRVLPPTPGSHRDARACGLPGNQLGHQIGTDFCVVIK